MRGAPLGITALLTFIAGMPAHAYPERPIRLIVASAPGGAPDILARAVAQQLSESAGQQIVVDNRAGASGLIGAEIAAKAASDGYTLFLGTTTLYAILPNLRRNLPYNIDRDFAAVTQIASASNVLVINPSVSAQSLPELIRLGKEKPGALNYASAGRGTPAHLAGEMLNLLAGIKMTHVPYKGAGPALLDVVAGQVQLIITSPIAAGPHIRSGKVRALASTGKLRNPALPALPAIAETLPDYDITQWWGISARAGTPAPVLQRIRELTITAVRAPAVSDRIRRTGAIPSGEGAERFAAFAKAERQRLGEIIRKAGISLD
jgi:tripartite-type tricarboxylate transporter receptor subunit TctC